MNRLQEAISKASALQEQFYVMGQVSGGVTGTRRGPVKGADGKIKYYDDKAEAEKEAARLRDTMGKHSSASFHYWVEEQ